MEGKDGSNKQKEKDCNDVILFYSEKRSVMFLIIELQACCHSSPYTNHGEQIMPTK